MVVKWILCSDATLDQSEIAWIPVGDPTEVALVVAGRKVNLDAISKCALMGIEGEKDDIAAVGQTKAALNLCKNIPDSKKKYHLQKGVGHYGAFSGSKFREQIVPAIKDFVYANDQKV